MTKLDEFTVAVNEAQRRLTNLRTYKERVEWWLKDLSYKAPEQLSQGVREMILDLWALAKELRV